MNITTKYAINQKVYAIFKEPKEPWVKIFDCTIVEITLDSDGYVYYVDKIFEEFKEDELFPMSSSSQDIVDRIDYLLSDEEGANHDPIN